MPSRLGIVGTLLLAASLGAQAPAEPCLVDGQFRWVELGQSWEQIDRLLGPPYQVAQFGADYVSWQYRLGDGDHHDPSHLLVFRRSTRRLLSITRSYEADQPVRAFFAAGQGDVREYREMRYSYPVLLRNLPGKGLLLAMGATRERPTTNQLVLMERDALAFFHPWLHRLLETAERKGPAK